jgi:hypothetical protein
MAIVAKRPIISHHTYIIVNLNNQGPEKLNSNDVTIDQLRRAGELTKVHYDKVAAIMEALAAIGFQFLAVNGRVYAVSDTVGAREAKEYLLKKDFKDTDFQIHLEYTRGWGMM